MPNTTHDRTLISSLRTFRTIHRTTGALLFIIFLFISLSGLLLGWKKNSGGLILAETRQGTSADLRVWLPLDTLAVIAVVALRDSVSPDLSPRLDRIDVRQKDGIVKFAFLEHYWGIQVDGATGKVLQIERRNSDIIEHLHDGSIVDKLFGWKGDPFKLVYTSVAGTALCTFTVTGFWLWFGPKIVRKRNRLRRRSP